MTEFGEVQRRERDAQRWAAIDERIRQHLRFYFMSGDEEHPGALTAAIGQVMGENRMEARAEVRRMIEEERRAFDARLVALEQRLKAAR